VVNMQQFLNIGAGRKPGPVHSLHSPPSTKEEIPNLSRLITVTTYDLHQLWLYKLPLGCSYGDEVIFGNPRPSLYGSRQIRLA